MPNVSITVSDGTVIDCYLDDFTDPWDEEKDTILMWHGNCEGAEVFIPMVPALARKYRVLRIDARGVKGGSAMQAKVSRWWAELDDASIGERLVDDALDVINQLGIWKIHWVGLSGGGFVGALFAASHPYRIKSLVLINMPYKVPREVVVKLAGGEKDIGTNIEKFGFREFMRRTVGQRVVPPKPDPRISDWYESLRARTPTHVAAAMYRYSETVNLDISGTLAGIKAPTLILAGEKTAIAPLEQERFMQQKIPNAQLIVFDGVGQGMQLFMADRCAEAVLNFIQSVD